MIQIQVLTASGVILAYGRFPTPPSEPGVELFDLADAEAPKLLLAGVKRRLTDGTVEVTPPPPPEPTEEELFPLDYGVDKVPTRPQLKAGVDTLQEHLDDPSPTAAETGAVVKLHSRALLYIMRRLGL